MVKIKNIQAGGLSGLAGPAGLAGLAGGLGLGPQRQLSPVRWPVERYFVKMQNTVFRKNKKYPVWRPVWTGRPGICSRSRDAKHRFPGILENSEYIFWLVAIWKNIKDLGNLRNIGNLRNYRNVENFGILQKCRRRNFGNSGNNSGDSGNLGSLENFGIPNIWSA